ncbi:type IV secretion system DNA-binding domain-containing protein [Candidatus Uhrbacteria bacterium]|nr:type IV secretion system DNA-binding domain-containing protein [Candidatus Uhrbacteria bacterium]
MVAKPLYDHDHENEINVFAETNFRNQRRRFGIKTDDRRRHMYLIGKTGMGKTTLIENMVISDINAGHGLAYIDPHGDTAQKLLDYIPASRVNDVVYFNPADQDFPIGFNILESVDPAKKHLVAAGLMGVFKKIWPDVWSARMEYILLNTVLALLDYPGATLLGINRLLVDPEYRAKVVALIQDPVVKTFWVKEFAAFSEKYRTEAIAPVQNKVGQFLSAAIIRNIVAQVKSTIDMRDIMDNQKIFILNLAKGLIGEENARLLGAMIITRLQLAAMERVDIPEAQRRDFYLYVDEFQNFATDSFANILSEARKYRLNIIIAHQYVEQLDEVVKPAVFGNVGTIVAFRVGGEDSELLESEFSPRFMATDLVNLAKYDVYLKLMIDGVASEPFSASTLPPIGKPTASEDKVVKVSRQRYAQPRAVVEDKVLRWSGIESGTTDQPGAAIITEEESEELREKIRVMEASSPKISGPAPAADGAAGKPMFEITCSVCGKPQKLSFEPDRSRPWYCKDHLEERRKQLESRPRPPMRPPGGSGSAGFGGPGRGDRPRPPRRTSGSASSGPRPPQPPRRPEVAAPDVKPVSLSAMFGKDLSKDAEPEVENEDRPSTPPASPKPAFGAGLVDLKDAGKRQPPAETRPKGLLDVIGAPPKPAAKPAVKPASTGKPRRESTKDDEEGGGKPLKPGEVIKF